MLFGLLPILLSASTWRGEVVQLLNGVEEAEAFGQSVLSPEDVNADGYTDLVVGSKGLLSLYLGSAEGLPSQPNQTISAPTGLEFGYQLARIGDANGDGFADILVAGGQLWASGEESGVAFLYFGGPERLDPDPQVFISPDPTLGDGFGADLGSGDLNGDGHVDLVIGSKSALYVYLGSADGIPGTSDYRLLPSPEYYFSYRFGADADFDGDGLDDVYIIQDLPGADNAELVVFPGGLEPSDQGPSSAVYTTSGVNTFFSSGDLNGDGYSDLCFDGDGHEVLVKFGSANGLSRQETVEVLDEAGERLGILSASIVQDMDGDGYGELAVGTLALSTPYEESVFLLQASPGITDLIPWFSIHSPSEPNTHFGNGLNSGADFNGNGRPELLVAPES